MRQNISWEGLFVTIGWRVNFNTHRNYDMALTVGEKLEFLNLWYVMICINDCLIIGGSSIKLVLEMKKIASEDLWDHCRLV